ncbi:MAG: phytanoyl-CoA dioxygenase family protein [Pseudomonadota bacterium]
MFQFLTKLFGGGREPLPPEFDARNCDPKAAAAALEANGLIVLRKILTTETVSEVYVGADRFIEEMSAYETQDELPDGIAYSVANSSFPLEQLWKSLEEGENPLIDGLRRSPVIAVMQAYFDAQSVILRAPNLRHQRSSRQVSHVPWHQDGFALPKDLRMVNCWLAVSPNAVGADSPGLEFLHNRPETVFPLEQDAQSPNYGFLEPERALLEPWEASSPVVRPILQAGDAVLFDTLMLHRTHSMPAMTERRVSAELRFTTEGPFIETERAGGRLLHVSFP